jgi:uncharacterized membrane protein
MKEEQRITGSEEKLSGDDFRKLKNRWELLYMLFLMIKKNKKWWLLPLLLMLAILSIFVNIFGNQAILPAIYTFF